MLETRTRANVNLSPNPKGVMILLDAKRMMIDFGRDVGQCVQCTSSSSVKSDEQHVLWLQERVDPGEIRKKRKYNTANNGTNVLNAEVFRKHLKVLKRGDAKDVVCWCYAQWCDGLSNAARSWMCVASSCEVRGGRTASLESEQLGYEREQQSYKSELECKTRGKSTHNGEAGTVCLCTHTTGQYNIDKDIVDIVLDWTRK